ncbi:uncharacterized protein LOC129928167 [Biomphalaria glabrata]|uniref:Uncharacterized protein LOC129928167 n=1 Tax=Biomphalaria glabrata TaxID=6526 RepID=A0A9W3BCK1_BIOGL|nr:uncharacterized protein LOC129928167 [Biomphalaria glabrata]
MTMDLAELASDFEAEGILLGFEGLELEDYVRRQIERAQRMEELHKAHELKMNAIRQEILEIRQRYRPQNLELNSTPARQDQEAEESGIMTHVETEHTAPSDTDVANKGETTTPDAPSLDQSTLSTQPNPPAQSNSSANCDAPFQPLPSSKSQHRKAPAQQPALHKNCHYPARKPRHDQNNQAHRDCNDSMRSHKPNRQKQQASQRISVMTAVPKPSVSNQQTRTDRTAGDPYVISILTVAPEHTALGPTKTGVLPALPHPVSSSPGIETILVNGRYVRSLFDTGCASPRRMQVRAWHH